MITPAEIETKEFSRAVRGYKMEEVDEFLDEIIVDMEKLLKDNKMLADTVDELREEILRHKKSETSVMNTLESAKKLMKDISESAEKRAEIIIKNARMEADAIVKDARDSIDRLTEENSQLLERVKMFKGRYRQMLEDELERVKGGSSEELFRDLERELEKSSGFGEFCSGSDTRTVPAVSKSADSPDTEELTYDQQLAELTEGISAPDGEPGYVGTAHAPKETVVLDSKAIDEMIGK